MKTKLLFALLLMGALSLSAQELSSPKDLLEIMEKSEIMYKLMELDKNLPLPNRSNHLNRNDFFVVDSADKRLVKEYDLPEEVTMHLDLAESYFTARDYSGARREYEKVLELAPEYYKVMTYIAQTHGREQDFDKALELYRKVIEVNRIDFLAHMLIADIYQIKGDYKKAAYHITYAQVLNRNNPRINKMQKDIYAKAKLKYNDFVFHPQFTMEANDDATEVSIHSATPWFIYAIAKAVWTYETDYAESKGKMPDGISMTEEKESIVCLLASLESAKKFKKKPEFAALNKALKAGMLEEFIIYEIWLPDYPWISYRFSEKYLDVMVSYVMHVRGGMKLK